MLASLPVVYVPEMCIPCYVWYLHPLCLYLFRGCFTRGAREKDWKNNMGGGGAAGLSVALLSRHTRTPRLLAAYAVGGAAITSVVAIATGRPTGG